MTTVEILEALMLVSFSVSWYWSIAKMVQTKVAAGKSLYFVLMICFGYVLGISSKLVAWYTAGALSPLVWVYGWNLLVTGFDAVLVVRYSKLGGQFAAPAHTLYEACHFADVDTGGRPAGEFVSAMSMRSPPNR